MDRSHCVCLDSVGVRERWGGVGWGGRGWWLGGGVRGVQGSG